MAEKRKKRSNNNDAIIIKRFRELNYCEKLKQLLEEKIEEQIIGLIKSIEYELKDIISNPKLSNYEEIGKGVITIMPNYKILRATFDVLSINEIVKSFGFYSAIMKYNNYDNLITIVISLTKKERMSVEY